MPVFSALNGHLPDTALAYLPWPEAARFRLSIAAAASAGRLAAAFRAHFSAPLLLTDAYRIFASQVELKASKGVWAATPGTSNHGLGIAIDFASGINVDGSVQHLWMVANAVRFGWINPAWAINWNPADGQHEPWHWEYHPELDTTPATPAPPTVHALPTIPEEDMPLNAADATLINGLVINILRGAEFKQIVKQIVKDTVPTPPTAAVLAAAVVDHPLDGGVGSSTLGQAVRDGRIISRRLEVAWRKFVNLPPV